MLALNNKRYRPYVGDKKIIAAYLNGIKVFGSAAAYFVAIEGLKDGVTWDGRTSSAWHEQPDGSLVECKPNELRIAGARRVENVSVSEAPYFGWATVREDAGELDGIPIRRVTTRLHDTYPSGITFKASEQFRQSNQQGWAAVRLRADTPVNLRVFLASHGASTSRLVHVTSTWQIFYIEGKQHPVDLLRVCGISAESVGGIATFEYSGVWSSPEFLETPPEFIDPDIDHGFGANAVKYFDTENSNTVDVNGVVTETVGAKLPEPIYPLLEPAGVNVASIPSAAYSSNPADWATYFASRASFNSDFIPSRFGDWPKLIADNIEDSKQHRLNWYGAGNPLNVGDEISISMWAKAGEYSHVGLHAWGTMLRGSAHTVDVNSRQTTNDSEWVVIFGEIDAFGFTKVTFTNTVVTANNLQFALYGLPGGMENTGAPYWAGDGASGLWIAGVDVRINEEPTSFTTGARTADGALTVSNISPSGNPQIKFVDENGDIKTEPVFGDELIVNGDFSDGPNGWGVSAGLDVTYDPTFSAVRNANNGSIRQEMDLSAGKYLAMLNVITVTGVVAVYSSLNAGGSWVRMQAGVNSWVGDRQAGAGTFYIELNAEGGSINLADVSYRKIHPLCEYDPDTKNLTVGHDTTKTRKIIGVYPA